MTARNAGRPPPPPPSWPPPDSASHSALTATFSGAVRSLRPPLVREVVCLTATPGDPLVRRFLEDLRQRGVPVPSPIAAQLTARE
ncbi:hypothetical protein [Nocardia sp. NPDC047038]|uniref:hypothetical protein n=1 Tax=Nocardia sp. NPDC047038 TaxID=3154338 RepID=UPI0033C41523